MSTTVETMSDTATAAPTRWTAQWKELYHEVGDTGLCTGCAGWVISCPHDVIGNEHEEKKYKPFHLEDELGIDNCVPGEKGCTTCTRACPRLRSREPQADEHLLGRGARARRDVRPVRLADVEPLQAAAARQSQRHARLPGSRRVDRPSLRVAPTAAVATLSRCQLATPTSTTAAAPTTLAPATTTTTVRPATGFRIITTSPLPNGNVGTEYTAYVEACCGHGTPYRWKLVAGAVPSRAAVRRHGSGARARASFTITVDPPLTLEITNQGDGLTPATVGRSYATNLFASGGVRPWVWSVIGSLPPGLALDDNTIAGTPTSAGVFSFTARVRSADGQQAERVFTINVAPPT